MDEIDNIILHSLRQIGCNLDEEISNLDEFSPSLFVQVVSKCIALIDCSLELPKTLPPGMAQRFTATASLAEACRSIGYRRDIGYQTFLYSNVTEIRRVLMFLIERLPKESTDKAGSSGQPIDDTTELETQIFSNVQAQLHEPWMPEFCRTGALADLSNTDSDAGAASSTTRAQIAFRQFVPKKLNIPFVTQNDIVAEIKEFWALRRLDENNLVPSVIAANDGAIKSNQTGAIDEPDRQVKFFQSPSEKLQQFCSSGSTSQLKSAQENNLSPTRAVERASGSSITGSLPVKTPLESLQEEIEQIRAEIEQNVELYGALEGERKEIIDSVDLYRKAIAKLMDEKKS